MTGGITGMTDTPLSIPSGNGEGLGVGSVGVWDKNWIPVFTGMTGGITGMTDTPLSIPSGNGEGLGVGSVGVWDKNWIPDQVRDDSAVMLSLDAKLRNTVLAALTQRGVNERGMSPAALAFFQCGFAYRDWRSWGEGDLAHDQK